MPFAVLMNWREPKDHSLGSFSVPHCKELPVPKLPEHVTLEEESLKSDGIRGDLSRMYYIQPLSQWNKNYQNLLNQGYSMQKGYNKGSSCLSQGDLLQLKEEPLDIVDGYIEKDPLAIEETKLIKSENLKIENEEVTIDEGTIEDSTKNFITCKRCINNSVHEGIIKEKSNECTSVYGDVTTEKDVVENISSKNKLPIQKGK
ncbi:uncharacterized protein LOC142317968 [Lycorma delicatula]|uniref:uncharacterized protein LOC142317968 n=1 Tax=Lycorma delicatula TaxID=130591 RepID=UPI003F50FEC9